MDCRSFASPSINKAMSDMGLNEDSEKKVIKEIKTTEQTSMWIWFKHKSRWKLDKESEERRGRRKDEEMKKVSKKYKRNPNKANFKAKYLDWLISIQGGMLGCFQWEWQEVAWRPFFYELSQLTESYI